MVCYERVCYARVIYLGGVPVGPIERVFRGSHTMQAKIQHLKVMETRHALLCSMKM